jgi:uroporphyrinogen decarboxylase
MTSLTGRDLILAGWKGEETGRVCFNVDIGPHYSSNLNYTTEDYFGNIETAIECQVKSVSDYTSDIITVPQNMMAWFATSACYRYKTRSEEVQPGAIKTMEDLDELEAVPALEIDGIKLLKESCSKINELAPDYASRVGLIGPTIDAAFLTGMENWIANTMENPEFAHKEMRLTTDATKERALEIVKNTDVLIFVVADTFASISTISPKIYKELVFPYEMELFQDLQDAAVDSKIIGLHICGFIDPIMDDIAQLPLDWVELDGPSSLQKMFEATKGKMMIRGNVGAEIFFDGSKEQIYEAVKQCIEVASGSPKYVLSTGCQIPLNAPLEQVRNFINAAQKYGSYS